MLSNNHPKRTAEDPLFNRLLFTVLLKSASMKSMASSCLRFNPATEFRVGTKLSPPTCKIVHTKIGEGHLTYGLVPLSSIPEQQFACCRSNLRMSRIVCCMRWMAAAIAASAALSADTAALAQQLFNFTGGSRTISCMMLKRSMYS